jgi:hypothetical protein
MDVVILSEYYIVLAEISFKTRNPFFHHLLFLRADFILPFLFEVIGS